MRKSSFPETVFFRVHVALLSLLFPQSHICSFPIKKKQNPNQIFFSISVGFFLRFKKKTNVVFCAANTIHDERLCKFDERRTREDRSSMSIVWQHTIQSAVRDFNKLFRWHSADWCNSNWLLVWCVCVRLCVCVFSCGGILFFFEILNFLCVCVFYFLFEWERICFFFPLWSK